MIEFYTELTFYESALRLAHDVFSIFVEDAYLHLIISRQKEETARERSTAHFGIYYALGIGYAK